MNDFPDWGLPVIVGVGLVLAMTLTNAIADRIRGREEIRSCTDCGDKLTSGDGATCVTCRGRRRRALDSAQHQYRYTPPPLAANGTPCTAEPCPDDEDEGQAAA